MFKPSVDYTWDEQLFLVERYRRQAIGCDCSEEAAAWYQKGLAYHKIAEKYGTHDYHYYFYNREHSALDMQKEKEYFLRAIECFRHSAESGHDIAMMIYGLYLFHFCDVDKQKAAFMWFQRASEKGFAVASYAMACCYHHGYGEKKSRNKSKSFFILFKNQWKNSLRQRALSLHLKFNMELPSVYTLLAWCSGGSYLCSTDLPGYSSPSWLFGVEKLGEPHFDIQLDTDVSEGMLGDDYFMECF